MTNKKSVSYKKALLFTFVDTVATKIVHPTSMNDTVFEDRLKTRSFTKMNTAVYNMKYFAHILSVETLDYKGYPTYLHLQWDYTNEWNNIPKSSLLIAGAHCLTEMKAVEHVSLAVFQNKKLARKWLGGRDPCSWINIYKGLIADPDGITDNPLHTCHVLSGWNKCFHIVRPIVPIDVDEAPIRYYVEWMTKVNHFPMIPVDDILARKVKGLVSCTCHDYLHYLFCKHTYGILKKREIILEFPATSTMNPAPVNKRKRGVGCPREMHPGEVLN